MVVLKNFIKLFLFFVSLGSFLLINSQVVLTKEIKCEMRGTFLELNDFNFENKNFNFNEFKNYITEHYDNFKDGGFNTVFVDISKFLDLSITKQFNEMTENILNFIVKEAVKRSLDVHGSFSDFSLKYVEDGNLEAYLTSLNEDSFIKNNREWIVEFNDKYYLDLGVHEVRDYLIETILKLSNKFNFDGVYIDGGVYPQNINKYSFNDSYSYLKYNEDKLSKENWRRQNVNDFIKILGEKFKSYKNELKFGIGVNYIWRSFKDDVNGIEYEGYSDYDRGAFDSLNISKNEYVNYIVVNIDDSISSKNEIKNVISWWERKLRTHLIDVFFQGDENIVNLVESVRENSFINGFILKNFKNLSNIMKSKALVPRFKSFDSYYTMSGIKVSAKIVKDKIEFNVFDEAFENTKNFVIYKFPYDDLDFQNGDYIKDVLPSGGKETKLVVNKDNGVYVVTKLNYNCMESKFSSAFIISEDFGLIEEKILCDETKIVNNEIQFLVNSFNKDNRVKFVIEKDGELLIESEFDKKSSYSFIPNEEGIYKLNVLVRKNDDDEHVLKSYLNFEVKDEYVLVLDAGHGGEELGAKGFNGVLEKDINLSICKLLNEDIKNLNKLEVINTRINDIKMDLSDRVKLCSFLGGDLFISVHQNAFDNEKVNGIETYYYLKEPHSKELCNYVQENLIHETEAYDRGVKTSNFVVLRENMVPSILIECGFITNEVECNKLIDEEYQRRISKAIADGVNKFLKLKNI